MHRMLSSATHRANPLLAERVQLQWSVKQDSKTHLPFFCPNPYLPSLVLKSWQTKVVFAYYGL